MNATETKIEVMQHFADGGAVEFLDLLDPDQTWVPVDNPLWNWDRGKYRKAPDKPKRRSAWVNIYESDTRPFSMGRPRPSKCLTPDAIACIRIEFEDGEGLD